MLLLAYHAKGAIENISSIGQTTQRKHPAKSLKNLSGKN
jgi:hypothetical protein